MVLLLIASLLGLASGEVVHLHLHLGAGGHAGNTSRDGRTKQADLRGQRGYKMESDYSMIRF